MYLHMANKSKILPRPRQSLVLYAWANCKSHMTFSEAEGGGHMHSNGQVN